MKLPYGKLAFFALLLVSLALLTYPSQHPTAAADDFNYANIAWLISASGLVLLMTPGLSFFYGGMVDPKNIISTMLQSFIALGIISFVWYVVGFSLAFGESLGGFIGNPLTFL